MHIPDIKESAFTVTDMVCTDITLAQVSSSHKTHDKLSAEFNGIGLSCNGNIQVAFIKDTVTASAYDSSISLDVTVLNDRSTHLVKGFDALCQPRLKLHLTTSSKIDNAILKLANGFIEAAVDGKIKSEIEGLIKGNLTRVVQAFNKNVIEKYLNVTPPEPINPVPGALPLNESGWVKLADYLLNQILGVHGVFSINRVMDYLTHGRGYFSKTNFNVNKTFNVESVGLLTFGLLGFNISGLDTWGDFTILEPLDACNLYSHTEMNSLNFSIDFFVMVQPEGVLSGNVLREEGIFSASLSKCDLKAGAFVVINPSVLGNYDLHDLLSPGCALSTLEQFNFTEFLFNMTVNELNLVTVGQGKTEADIDQLIDNFLQLSLDMYRSILPAFFNGVVAGPVRLDVNTIMADLIEQARCRVEEDATRVQVGAITGISGTVVFFAIFSFLLFRAYRSPAYKAEEKQSLLGAGSSSSSSSNAIYGAAGDGGINASDHVQFNSGLSAKYCLALQPAVPQWARYGIVLLLLLNITFFIWSNTNLGAGVNLSITTGKQSTIFPALFDFSLANSIRDMWNAGVYPLSIFIALFSGTWPYVKLIMMLYCWVMPVRWLSVSSRERVLMFLDAYGKWSLIDAYVLVLMMVAFRFHFELPAAPDVPTESPALMMGMMAMANYSSSFSSSSSSSSSTSTSSTSSSSSSLSSLFGGNSTSGNSTSSPGTSIDVIVEPGFGFHSFLGATIMSLILSHIVLAFHRRTLPYYNYFGKGTDAVPVRQQGLNYKGHRIYYKRWVQLLIVAITIASLGFVFVGIYVTSFEFDFAGLAGYVLPYLNGDPHNRFSVISLGRALPNSSSDPNGVSVRWIQASFILFAIVLPMLRLVLLTLLWVLPLAPPKQKKLFVLAEIFNAWAALEVFVFALIAALLEIRQFASFIIGDKCDFMTQFLINNFNEKLNGDDTCFDVVATLDSGVWYLMPSALLAMFVSSMVMGACHKALHQRAQLAYGLEPEDTRSCWDRLFCLISWCFDTSYASEQPKRNTFSAAAAMYD